MKKMILWAALVLPFFVQSCKDDAERTIDIEKKVSMFHSKLDSSYYHSASVLLRSLKHEYSKEFPPEKIDSMKALVLEKINNRKLELEKLVGTQLPSMKKDADEFQESVFYHHPNSPKYRNSRNSIYAYIVSYPTRSPGLRFVITYTADSWLFIKDYQIKADSNLFRITEQKYGEVESNHAAGSIWEWLDRLADEEEIDILTAIAEAGEAKIRYNGRQYYDDHTVSKKDKTALKEMIALYLNMDELFEINNNRGKYLLVEL